MEYQRTKEVLMCTARPTWMALSVRALDKGKFAQINNDLEDIIEINTEEQVRHFTKKVLSIFISNYEFGFQIQ